MKKIFCISIVFIMISTVVSAQFVNPLAIPDTLSGSNMTLNVQSGTHSFFQGTNSPTYGYNGNYFNEVQHRDGTQSTSFVKTE